MLKNTSRGVAVFGPKVIQNIALGVRNFHSGQSLQLHSSLNVCDERRYRDSDQGYRNNSRRDNFRSGGGNSYSRPRSDDSSRSSYGRPQSRMSNAAKRRMDQERSETEIFKGKNFKVTTLDADSFTEEVTIDSLVNDNLVDKSIQKAITSMGFASLTPVQQRTIKPILTTQNDVVAKAKTGTGKTLAFLLPLFQHLLTTKLEEPFAIKAVIVTPTRDLALQISAEIRKLHESNNALRTFRSLTLIGGTNLSKSLSDMSKIKPNIIVGTPGRVNDVLDRVGARFFKNVDFKVLDEADTLLQIGFQTELSLISKKLNELNATGPQHIRTMLFSATMDHNVQELAANIMNKDECLFIDTVDKNESEAHERIDQKLVISKRFSDSMVGLVEAIDAEMKEKDNFKAILFLPTVRFVDFFSDVLQDALTKRIDVIKFHGRIDQKKRTKLVERFKNTNHGIFVCTDVGARGMHFPSVEHVYQLSVPTRLPNYIHRIGRTARAGKEGAATIFLCNDELKFVDELKRSTNVVIKNQVDYTITDEKNWERIAHIISENFDFTPALKTVVAFYKGIQKEYGFNNKIVLNILKSYSEVKGDPSSKLNFTPNELSNFFSNRDIKYVSEYINVKNSSRYSSERDEDDDHSRNFRENNYRAKPNNRGHRFENKYDNSAPRRQNNYSKKNYSFDD